jgi:small-conductance mechanosensitive channel
MSGTSGTRTKLKWGIVGLCVVILLVNFAGWAVTGAVVEFAAGLGAGLAALLFVRWG